MKKYLLLFVLLCLGSLSFAQKVTLKVLFIGNSLTFVNDLPGTLQKVAHSAGDSIYVDQSAIPGYTLAQHVQDTATTHKIKKAKWDYVVIQEQSQIPSFPPAQVDTQFYPYAHILDSLVHRNDSCTHTVFYLTPGHKYGDPSNCSGYPILCTYDGVQSRLRQSYLHAADTSKAMVAPVGIAWYHSWHKDSTISLWQADRTHPTVAGAYLSACTFYATLTGKDCSKVTYVTSGITAKQASFLRGIAQHTVLDSLKVWYIGVFNPHAGFTYKPSGLNMTFSNTSKYASHYKWLFGDGGSSFAANATHTYSSKAPYTATLIAYHDCMTDTFKQTLGWTGVDEISLQDLIKIYPNPAHAQTTFDIPIADFITRIEIRDLTGHIVLNTTLSGHQYIWQHAQSTPGVYFVLFTTARGGTFRRKVIVD